MQGRFRTHRAFEIIVLAGKAATAAGLRPVGAGGGARHLIGGGGAVRRGAALVKVFLGRIHCLARLMEAGIVVEVQLVAFGGALGAAAFGVIALGAFTMFEERIALDFGLYELGKFDVRQLQELDRLLQLRSHHQGLALAHVETL